MCSFVLCISKKKIASNLIKEANKFIKSRGPSKTNIFSKNINSLYIQAIHNLLDISGESIIQPIINNDKHLLLFNGEIYNPKVGNLPDTLLLMDNLSNNTIESFLLNCRGEFAICTYDIKNKKIQIFRDLIGTKPLFYGFSEDKFIVSSYKAPIEYLGLKIISEVKPNEIISIDISNFNNPLIESKNLFSMNLEQNIDNLELWEKNFLRSVEERADHFETKLCVPLSAGYDSGAIACALNLLNISYESVTVGDSENSEVLEKRIKINLEKSCKKHHQIKPLNKKEYKNLQNNIIKKVGEISYSHIDGNRKRPIFLHEDCGAIGLAKLCQVMSNKGFNTILSGSGADEIISDYGFGGKKLFSHSEFGGYFPEKLESIFPWKKFYGDSQESYLRKDEMISGLYGMEGRYPFLDKDLIQSFLNISKELKNERYKNCIASFLEKNYYPYEPVKKDGFYPLKSKLNFGEKILLKIRNKLLFIKN